MSHNLNFNESTGKHSFFSVKQKTWHGLGTIVESCPTSAEAIGFAGLDYHIDKRPLFTLDNLASELLKDTSIVPEAGLEVPNFFATFRTDTEQPLGVVGKDYRVVQNVEAFAFFDSIIGGGDGILYETVAALGKGERIFITESCPHVSAWGGTI